MNRPLIILSAVLAVVGSLFFDGHVSIYLFVAALAFVIAGIFTGRQEKWANQKNLHP